MARQLIAGNWKMNTMPDSAAALAGALAEQARGSGAEACDWLVCPPFPLIPLVANAIAGSAVALGGQDCHPAEAGAHTGDTSAMLLARLGCSHVIVGHSERRHDHGEDDALVRAKAEAGIAAGLVPIICVGETRAERDAGRADAVIESQLRGSLPGDGEIVVAYEPVWAIGTGLTATPEDVREMHAAIHALLIETLGEAKAAATRILYGGSVKPDNAAELLATAHVGGALVGGASLDAQAFCAIGAAARPI
jgi:triosephosphate isomerase